MINLRFPFYYKTLNKILQESNGDFVAGKKLTYGDFWLASMIDIWDGPMHKDAPLPIMPFNLPPPRKEHLFENFSQKFPRLHQLKNLRMNLPKIKEWIEKRPICLKAELLEA